MERAALLAAPRATGLISIGPGYCCNREIQFLSLNCTRSRSWRCSEPRASASGVLTAPNLTVTELAGKNAKLPGYKPVSVPLRVAVIPLVRPLLTGSSDLPGS